MWLVWGIGDVHTGFWWGNLMEEEHLEDSGFGGRIILRWIFERWVLGGMDWIDLLRTGTDGGLL